MELMVRHGGETLRVLIERRHEDGSSFDVTLGERTYRVDWRHLGPRARSLVVDDRQHELGVERIDAQRGVYQVAAAHGREEIQVMGLLAHLAETRHAATETGGVHRVAAYMPGRVAGLLVAEGDEVAAGQGVLVLEAMKMENEIQADRAGRVTAVFVEEGQAVETGDPLYQIES